MFGVSDLQLEHFQDERLKCRSVVERLCLGLTPGLTHRARAEAGAGPSHQETTKGRREELPIQSEIFELLAPVAFSRLGVCQLTRSGSVGLALTPTVRRNVPAKNNVLRVLCAGSGVLKRWVPPVHPARSSDQQNGRLMCNGS